MTPAARILRRLLFLPVKAAEEREFRLQEAHIRTDHARRNVQNAMVRLDLTAARLHALTADTLDRINGTEEPHDQDD